MSNLKLVESIPVPEVVEVDPASLWPDPIPLASTLLPVPKFQPELLPEQLREWVTDIGERMNVPIEFVAVPAIIAAGTILGRKIGVRPERHSNWLEVCNLWGAIIGPPGTLKSPAVREAFGSLLALEQEAAREHERAVERFKPEQQLFEIEEAQAKQTAKALIKKSGDDHPFARADALEALEDVEEPEFPVAKRYITNDATPEKLGELCKGNPNGLLIHRDELLTMFTDLDREEKAAGRGFIMSGWTGLDGYTVDRIGRGTVRIEAVNVSVFGTAQPNRLTSYMRNSFAHHDDGLVQRLQLLVWPDPPGKFKKCDRSRNEYAREVAMRAFERLNELDVVKQGATMLASGDPGFVPYLHFDFDAQDAFDDWREVLENRISALAPSDPWRGHLSKYRGLATRLALIFHLFDGAMGPISLAAWAKAEAWIEYLESHALRAYDAMRTDNTDIAQKLAAKIRDGSLGKQFVARDVYRPNWSGLKKPAEVSAALKVLIDYDWLSVERVSTGGKSKEIFTVNPKVLKLAA